MNQIERGSTKKFTTSKLVTMAMLIALAYVVMAVGRIPMVLFLKYDPKDIIIVLSGFIYGPLSALIISAAVSFIELVTVSHDGIIGFLMNVLASCAFACPAAYIYTRRHTRQGALIALLTGVAAMSTVMLVWNYILTPVFMHIPRAEVVPLLTSAILPFNLIKGGLNAGLTLLLYKPVVTGLRRANLIPPSEPHAKTGSLGMTLIALLIIVTCVLLVLSLNHII